MSWLYSRALVEGYLGESCLDGAQFALWSGISTQQQSSLNGKTTASWKPSRYGMTYKPLTDDLGETVLMSYLADSHAKTSASPEKVQALTESAAECGNTWRELWTRFDPVSCSWKTHQCLFTEDLPESSVTFPKWGMIRDGVLWEQTTPERRTIERESGFWPTPCLPGNGGSHGKAKLKAMLWPTPRSSDGTHGGRVTPRKSRDGGNLIEAVSAEMYPTPHARDWKDSGPTQGNRKSPNLGTVVGGHLNPTWVEWLMGWPIGWTDLKPLATDKYQEWQQQHSIF